MSTDGWMDIEIVAYPNTTQQKKKKELMSDTT